MRTQSGMSLVELLIALALSLGVMVGLSSVYVAAKQSFRFQETTGRLQEDGVFALDSIARNLRMAGYAGCVGIDKVTTPSVAYYPGSVLSSTSPDGFDGVNPLAQIAAIQAESTYAEVNAQPYTAYNFVRGFDTTVPSGMVSSTSPLPSANSDSIFFAGASAKSVTVSVAMTAPAGVLTIGTDPFGWASASANSGVYDFVISNCGSSSLFKGKVTASGGVFSVDHSTALGNSSANFASSTLFGLDASVMPAEWHYYYIATRSGASTPSLYHVYYNGNSRQPAEEVVANVESMKLYYGENINGIDSATTLQCTLATGGATCVATLQPDVWRTTAGGVTNWSRVVAVRVGLMMVSSEDNASLDVTLPSPTLLGASYTQATGATKRLHKEFSTTVVLRNRVAAR